MAFPLFTPVRVRTTNVQNALRHFARERGIEPVGVTFDLESIKTFYRTREMAEWGDADDGKLLKFGNRDAMLQPDLRLRQEYMIRIRPVREEPFVLRTMLVHDAEMARLTATVLPESILPEDETLEDFLRQNLNREKLLAGALINIYDSAMHRDITRALNRGVESLPEIVLCEGVVPVPSRDDALILHYRLKKQPEEGRVDYASRGFAVGVDKGEVVIEYRRAKDGASGRSCNGRFLHIPKARETARPRFRTGPGVTVEEDAERILYRAAQKGYVSHQELLLDISNILETGQISFRETGSVEADQDKNVSVDIRGRDVVEDSVTPGITIESSRVRVKGIVGAGATIRANYVEVEGQTHKNARIEAEQMTLALHRGDARGKVALIGRLEGGTVRAEQVEVAASAGGKIEGERVHLHSLGNHTTIVAGNSIEIDEVLGEGNILEINPDAVGDGERQRKMLKEEISDREREQTRLQIRHEVLMQAVILEEEQMQQAAELEETVAEVKEQLSRLKKEIKALDQRILNGAIRVKGGWVGVNRIRFRDAARGIDLQHVPRGKESHFSIIASKEGYRLKIE